MKNRGSWGFRGLVCLVLALASCLVLACADLLLPEASGTTVKKNGKMVADCSNTDQGYVMVRTGKSTKKRLKVRVVAEVNKQKDTLNYDLNGDGDYEVYPFQFGDRKYTVGLYENVSGKKYAEEGKISLNVALQDPNICFLYPNQYVNYNAETECVIAANEMCAGMTDPAKIYETVCDYVKTHFMYDYIKSVTVKAGVLPDIDGCWSTKMGICQDLSAVTIAMLRSQGVPARLMIGTLGSNIYHAWVTAVVNGEEKFFDPTVEVGAGSRNETYTTERYY